MRDRIRQLTSPRYLTQLALALRYMRGSCSQEGEDLLLERLYLLPTRGTYIDIGAGHPFRWSNTTRFYRKGWSGTVVEPNPSRAALLRRFRRRDRVIQALVGAPEPTVVMAMYEDANYNTIDRELVAQRAAGGLRPVSEITAQSMELRTIQVETAARSGNPISLICVDTEGSDLAVLKSGVWDDGPLRPIVVVAEILDVVDIRVLINHPVVEFMEAQGYVLSSRLKESAVFIDRGRSTG
jgi:FkbM family methyltransferase